MLILANSATLGLFRGHSAFISHSVTSEAFAIKPKPRLVCAIVRPPLSSSALYGLLLLYRLLGLYLLLATSEAFAP